MHQADEDLPTLGYVEPYEGESISHYLGCLRRFKANNLCSAYSLGKLAELGANVEISEIALSAIAIRSDLLHEVLPE
jgi:hypothetical protein